MNWTAQCTASGALSMNYGWYLFGFSGRINRAKYWLAMPAILFCMIVLGMLMNIVSLAAGSRVISFSFSTGDIFALIDPESFRKLSTANLSALMVRVTATPLFLWLYVAVSVKRLHDRDKSGWWMIPFFVMPGLYSHFDFRLGDSIAAALLELAVFVVCFWALVELFFLRGTRGSNRFGADPLTATPIDGSRNSGPGWDQLRPREFVPHSAGPSPGPHVNRGHE
jgi:uncharacterized membrane protein YhaH (DUF805 family)